MNHIEQILEKKLKERFNINLTQYQKEFEKEQIEWDKELIEAGILACAKKVKE